MYLSNRWKVAELSSFILRINCFLNQIHTMRMECTLPWIYACLEVEFYWWGISPSQMCAPWNHSNKMDGFLKQSYYYCTAYNTIHIYPKPYVHTSTFTNEYDYYSFERLVFSLFTSTRLKAGKSVLKGLSVNAINGYYLNCRPRSVKGSTSTRCETPSRCWTLQGSGLQLRYDLYFMFWKCEVIG